jgi:uncharacterized protein YidB (DUF937 family)
MRKRIIMAVAGSILFLAGILAGVIISGGIPAFASKNTSSTVNVSQSHSSSATGYCQLYEQTLASKLGVSESKLESANSAALQAVITQMAKDGKLTSQQASMLAQMVQEYSSQPCSHINQILKLGKGGNAGALNQVLAGARQSVESAVATSLGISADTLKSDLAAGQTIPQIAQAHGISLSTVNNAYLTSIHGLLSQAVSKGYLTQDQSNSLYSRVTAAVNAGHYPLLEGGAKRGVPAV